MKIILFYFSLPYHSIPYHVCPSSNHVTCTCKVSTYSSSTTSSYNFMWIFEEKGGKTRNENKSKLLWLKWPLYRRENEFYVHYFPFHIKMFMMRAEREKPTHTWLQNGCFKIMCILCLGKIASSNQPNLIILS